MSDSQILSDLLDQIPLDEQIDSVYTNGAYDTKQCIQIIADQQAHAVIHLEKMQNLGRIKRRANKNEMNGFEQLNV